MAMNTVTLCHMGTSKRLDVAGIGQRLLERREHLRLGQEELADRASLSRAYISRLERGVVPNPKLVDLAQVADALGMSVADLMAPPPTGDDTEAFRREAQAVLGAEDGELLDAIVQKVRNRPANDRQSVLRIVDILVASLPPLSHDRPD